MDEFLKSNYGYIITLIEFIAAFTGVILYKKYKNTHVKYLIYFLVYTFFIDTIGDYPSILKKLGYFHLIKGTLIESNYWWYTIFWWIGLSVIMVYLNYRVVKTIRFKKILKYGFYLYSLQVVLYILFRFENLFSHERYITISSLWIILLSIVIYFFETLKSEKIILFYKSVYFYFNTVFFIWVLIIIPMNFFEVYNVLEDWNYVLFKWKIYLTLNFFLYSTLSAALIFCKPESE